MFEYWEKTLVTGHGENRHTTELLLHRRGEDALSMAMRRNPLMAGCNTFTVETEEAFIQIREDDSRRTRMEIPHDDRTAEEWDW
jgi:hypothetical protein